MRNILKLNILLGLILITLISSGQDVHITNGNQDSVSWDVSSTWDANGIPDLNGNTLNITISGGDTVYAGALAFKKETTLTIDSLGMLILQSTVDVDLDAAKSFVIIVKDGGTLHVVGDINVKKETTFDITGNVGVTGDVNFTGNPLGSISVSDPGSLSVGGTITGGVVPTGTGTVSENDPDPLPIELTYFNANNNKTNVTLNWQTASEENNDYFDIQRSTDAENFNTIGTVYGSGNSSINIDYNFTDESPIKGVSYYRLIQYDYNGDYEIHKTISANWDGTVSDLGSSSISVYPNPYRSGNLVLELHQLEPNASISLTIMDIIGNPIFNGNMLIPANGKINIIPTVVNNLNRGIYSISVQTDNRVLSKKVIVN